MVPEFSITFEQWAVCFCFAWTLQVSELVLIKRGTDESSCDYLVARCPATSARALVGKRGTWHGDVPMRSAGSISVLEPEAVSEPEGARPPAPGSLSLHPAICQQPVCPSGLLLSIMRSAEPTEVTGHFAGGDGLSVAAKP